MTRALLLLVLLLLCPHSIAPDSHRQEAASRGGGGGVITVVATAYTRTGNHTRSGTWPRMGTVAVDPTVIPLGSLLYVEGYGFGQALDTGGDIRGARVDLYMETEKDARAFGRRTERVRVLP